MSTPPSVRAASATPRAAIYCRVSSPGQQENGSLEEQEARCRALCTERGYQVVEPPFREVFSGEDVERPRLDALREAIRTSRLEVVVADKIDRFSRADPTATAIVLHEADQYGVRVEFVEVPGDTFQDQILRAVLQVVARVEHKKIRERTNAGKRRRVLGDPINGKPQRLLPGNVPRYGWRYADADKSRYVRDETQATIIERIYRELGEQGRSLHAICRDLDAEGVVPPTLALARAGYAIGRRKVSAKWHPSSVARMLKEPCYWGEAIAYRYQHAEKRVRDPKTGRLKKRGTVYRHAGDAAIVPYPPEVWPGIVTKELARKALARLKQNQVEAERQGKNTGKAFLRAGLIRCGACGANLTLHAHADYQGAETVLRYVCGRHREFLSRHTTDDCPMGAQVNIRTETVEYAVWWLVLEVLTDTSRVPDAYTALMERERQAGVAHQSRITMLEKHLAEGKRRRARLVEALGEIDDAETRREFTDKLTELAEAMQGWADEQQRLLDEQAVRAANVEDVRAELQDFSTRLYRLERLETAERRRILTALGVHVWVWPAWHAPWFAAIGDLPGLEGSWMARRASEVTRFVEEETLSVQQQKAVAFASFLDSAPIIRSPRQYVALPDTPPDIPEQVRSEAMSKWTAPVVSSSESKAKQPASIGVQQ